MQESPPKASWPKPTHRVWHRVWAGISALLTARAATAEPTRPVRMDYQGTVDCPGAPWFLARIRARTERVRFESAEEAPWLDLVVRVNGSLLEGSAELTGTGVDPVVRRVRGQTCEEVVDALALIVAVALDPSVSERPAATPQPAADSPPTAPLVRERQEPVRSEPQLAKPIPVPAPATSMSRAPARSWELAVGAGPAIAAGVAPNPAPGLVLFLRAARLGSRSWAPSVVLSLEADRSGLTREEGIGDARFLRVVGRFSGCPVKLSLGPSLGVWPCVALEVGGLNGTGRNTVDRKERLGAWVAPGFELRAEWRPLPHFLVTLNGLLSFPLYRDRFFFGPDHDVFTAPAVAGSGSLGLGVPF